MVLSEVVGCEDNVVNTPFQHGVHHDGFVAVGGNAEPVGSPIFFEPLHGLEEGFVEGCLFGADPVEVEDVHVIKPEPLEAQIKALQELVGGGFGKETASLPVHGAAGDLRGQEERASLAFFQDLAEHLFVPSPLVDVGRVEEGDSRVQGRRDKVRVVGVHDPHTHGRERDPGLAEEPLRESRFRSLSGGLLLRAKG